jgi:hypothetical protein
VFHGNLISQDVATIEVSITKADYTYLYLEIRKFRIGDGGEAVRPEGVVCRLQSPLGEKFIIPPAQPSSRLNIL